MGPPQSHQASSKTTGVSRSKHATQQRYQERTITRNTPPPTRGLPQRQNEPTHYNDKITGIQEGMAYKCHPCKATRHAQRNRTGSRARILTQNIKSIPMDETAPTETGENGRVVTRRQDLISVVFILLPSQVKDPRL
jgi:hypothetical protein